MPSKRATFRGVGQQIPNEPFWKRVARRFNVCASAVSAPRFYADQWTGETRRCKSVSVAGAHLSTGLIGQAIRNSRTSASSFGKSDVAIRKDVSQARSFQIEAESNLPTDASFNQTAGGTARWQRWTTALATETSRIESFGTPCADAVRCPQLRSKTLVHELGIHAVDSTTNKRRWHFVLHVSTLHVRKDKPGVLPGIPLRSNW